MPYVKHDHVIFSFFDKKIFRFCFSKTVNSLFFKFIFLEKMSGIAADAMKNYREWYPEGKVAFEETDPELSEIFVNFAFGDVQEESKIDQKTRIIVTLASMVAQQTLSQFKLLLGAAFSVGLTAVEIKEVVIQTIPYVGIAKALDFINACNEEFTKRGIKLPLEGNSTTTRETRQEKGFDVQTSIFGDVIRKAYDASPANQLHIQKFLSAHCFGDFYTRKCFDVKTRELITFATILSLGGCEPQLKGHIAGNIAVGATKETLLAVVTQLIPYLGYPRSLNAIRCINEVVPEN